MAAKRRRTKGRTGAAALAVSEPTVNAFAAQHGEYVPSIVVDLTGELGGRRNAITKVVMNRGGTAIDRWIQAEERLAAQEDADGRPLADRRRRLFGEAEQRAIRFCGSLWSRAAGLQAIDYTREQVDGIPGWSQHEALAQLAEIKLRIPRAYWNVFEAVCRDDEEAGVAGSRLANNSRSAIDAAKITVAFVASLVAMWQRL